MTITSDTSLREALDMVRGNPFRHLLVVQAGGKLVGIATAKDLA